MTRRTRASRGSRAARAVARAFLAALALTAALAARDASPARADSLSPIWRSIVLKGAAMPQLVGSPKNHLEVLALHVGRLAPIPFQVDEVLPDGRYALPDGPAPLADDSPGILDRDDEVAMMFSDLGDRAWPPPRELPSGALEIEALDAARGVRRYAYIAAVPSPRRSAVSYVSYDPSHSRVEGGAYAMTFRGDFPVGLALKDGRGNLSPSLIDGSQVQAAARVLMLFKLRLNADGMTNRVSAWHGGPIRLIRRVTHSLKLTFGIKSPPVLSEEVFYRDRAEDSFAARVPWVPRLFFTDVRVRAWFDFVGLDGFALSWSGSTWHVLAPGAKDAAPAAKDAALAANGSALTTMIGDDPPEARWLALKGRGRIVMQTFTPSPDFAALRRRLYYCDGAAAASADCARGGLQIGYSMSGWENLAAGAHRVDSVLLILPDGAKPEAVVPELSSAPLVSVRRLPRAERR